MAIWAQRTWSGDWKRRIFERLSAQGFATVQEYLRANPGTPYLDLAKGLGLDVAASQLINLHIGEALENGRIREAAADMLVRFLHRYLPEGWILKPGEKINFKTASALAGWMSEFKLDERVRQYYAKTEAVVQHMLENFPPVGWTPLDAQDPYIRQAFNVGWPEEDRRLRSTGGGVLGDDENTSNSH